MQGQGPVGVVARIRERCTMLSAPICEGVERGRGIVWIHPDIVAEVTFSELMQRRLRDPVLRRVALIGVMPASRPLTPNGGGAIVARTRRSKGGYLVRCASLLVAVVVAVLIVAPSVGASEKLIGVWRIESLYTEVRTSGERVSPLGDKPKGYIAFTPEKRLLVVVTAPDRKTPQTDEDRAAAFRSMFAATGVYRIEGDKHIVKVEAAWNENLVNEEQGRTFTIDGDKLTITSDWGPSGLLPGRPEARGVSVYRRVSAN